MIKGNITLNGQRVNEIDLISITKPFTMTISNNTSIDVERSRIASNSVDDVKGETIHMITVKQYMTKPASPEFDFMSKWNNNIPMPLITMVGTVIKETRGMIYMKLHGDIVTVGKPIMSCLCCGRPITNKISQYFGMGPICGEHNYVNPFDSDEELNNAIETYRKEYLNKLTWEGWVIKSAIKEDIILSGGDK